MKFWIARKYFDNLKALSEQFTALVPVDGKLFFPRHDWAGNTEEAKFEVYPDHPLSLDSILTQYCMFTLGNGEANAEAVKMFEAWKDGGLTFSQLYTIIHSPGKCRGAKVGDDY
eukprot:SAG11_NODE_2247_length_3636_cov_3.037037_3_plen_114_part_00